MVAAELLSTSGQRDELRLGTSGQGDELGLTGDGLSSGQGDGSLGSGDDVVVRRLDGGGRDLGGFDGLGSGGELGTEGSASSDDVVDESAVSGRSRSGDGGRSSDLDVADRGRGRSGGNGNWGRSHDGDRDRSRDRSRSGDWDWDWDGFGGWGRSGGLVGGFGDSAAAGTADDAVAPLVSDVSGGVGHSISIGEAVRSGYGGAGFSLLFVVLIAQLDADHLGRSGGSSGDQKSQNHDWVHVERSVWSCFA